MFVNLMKKSREYDNEANFTALVRLLRNGCVMSIPVQFSSVQFAKINLMLSAKHFRTTTQ